MGSASSDELRLVWVRAKCHSPRSPERNPSWKTRSKPSLVPSWWTQLAWVSAWPAYAGTEVEVGVELQEDELGVDPLYATEAAIAGGVLAAEHDCQARRAGRVFGRVGDAPLRLGHVRPVERHVAQVEQRAVFEVAVEDRAVGFERVREVAHGGWAGVGAGSERLGQVERGAEDGRRDAAGRARPGQSTTPGRGWPRARRSALSGSWSSSSSRRR